MERRKVHNYWKSKYLCNINILYYKLDIFLIFIKKSTFLSYIYKGHGVKGPIPHCRGLGGPKGPPVLCKKMQEDAGPGWNLPELSWFQTKENIYRNPPEAHKESIMWSIMLIYIGFINENWLIKWGTDWLIFWL